MSTYLQTYPQSLHRRLCGLATIDSRADGVCVVSSKNGGPEQRTNANPGPEHNAIVEAADMSFPHDMRLVHDAQADDVCEARWQAYRALLAHRDAPDTPEWHKLVSEAHAAYLRAFEAMP